MIQGRKKTLICAKVNGTDYCTSKTFFAAFLFPVACLLPWIFAAGTLAAAQEISTTAPPQVDCANSALTGDNFLDAFYAIAMHKDLADVPFIEQVLKVKFDAKFTDQKDGNGQPWRSAVYSIQSLGNLPISIYLFLHVDENNQPRHDKVMTLDFNGRGISECLRISQSAFDRKFGGGFLPGHSSGPDGSFAKTLAEISKDRSKVSVGYGYSGWCKNPVIWSPAISQNP